MVNWKVNPGETGEKENIQPLPKLEGGTLDPQRASHLKVLPQLFQKVTNFPIWAACCYGNLPETPVV